MNTGKKLTVKKFLGFGLAFVCLSCSNFLAPPSGAGNQEQLAPGSGVVTISLQNGPENPAPLADLSPDPGRTILPSGAGLYYTLVFTDTANLLAQVDAVISTGTTATVTLPVGTWNLAVKGYLSREDAEAGPPVSPVVTGNALSILISGSGTPSPVTVPLGAAGLSTGILSYKVSHSSSPGVTRAILTLTDTQTSAEVNIDLRKTTATNSFSSSGATGQVSLASGYYRVRVYLYNGKIAVQSDIAHIYDSLTTPAAFSFTATGFADPADTTALDAAITAADAAKVGVRVSANGDGVPAGEDWVTQSVMDAFNDAIAAARYEAELAIAQPVVDAAESALTSAIGVFNAGKTAGGYDWNTDPDLGLYIGTNTTPESNTKTLALALAWLKTNGVSNTDYTILLGNDESLIPWTLGGGGGSGDAVAVDNKTGVRVTLKGKDLERIVSVSQLGSLLTVSTGVTLTLDSHITLKGRLPNDAALVQVNSGGKLIIKDGGRIIDNINGSSTVYGGGVCVTGSGSSLEMLGSEISGNTSYYGGGVYFSGTTFTMSGSAVISGNSSYSSYGGGVYVYSGSFNLQGGTVSGNRAQRGGGVYIYQSDFSKTGGIIYGDTNTSHSAGSDENTATEGRGHALSVEDQVLRNGDISATKDVTITYWSTLSYYECVPETSDPFWDEN
jgi:hypothetical protein